MSLAHHNATPPAWAEGLLQFLVQRDHRDSISGDLLEEYRDRMLPARGATAANRWYVREVVGYLWRATWIWAVVFAAAVLLRNVLDLLDPPQSYHLRSVVTTWTAIALFVSAGFFGARRTRSFVGGALAGFAVGFIAALITVGASGVMLAFIASDPRMMHAIARSGGLGEAFILPFVIVLPGTVFATLAAALGRLSTLGWRLHRI
jgi:hypothetical protein